jgi:hypothetical protein
MQKKSKKYTNLGLRRDKNLSDVGNPTASLNNLLNNLVNDDTKTFISEDLDAIRGLQNTSITPTKLSDLANIRIQYSTQVGDTIQDVLVTPLVTLKDRIDNSKSVTGDTPAIAGGLGLLARFVPSTNINAGSAASTGDTIFTTNASQVQEVFWELGTFSFPGYIDNSFVDQYGGIQWTGYFSPQPRDSAPNIFVATTGLVIFEVDPNENGNWQTLLSFYAANRTVNITAGSGSTSITLGSGQGKFVGVGDYFTTSTNLVTAVSGDVVTLSTAYTGGTITVSKQVGKDVTSGYATMPPVEIGNQLKIRISYWYPNTGLEIADKTLYFDYLGGRLPFQRLYATKPSQSLGPFEIRQFLQDAVTPYQPNVGLSGTGNYKNLFVNSSLISNYFPKSSLAEIRKAGPVAIACTSTNNLISSGSDLSGVEVGNIIVPAVARASTLITSTIQIKDTINSNIKVLTSNIGNTITDTVNFVDHRGFIGWYYATSAGTTVTLPANTTAGLRTGFIVITPTSGAADYRYITSLGASTFVTDAALGLTGEQVIYVYSDRSLIDTSKDVYCAGVFGQVLDTTTNAGTNTLAMRNVSGVAIGQVIQYSGSIPDGTTVSNIVGNTITLSTPLINLIKGSSTIVFAPAGTGVNKEACVIPLDTAPPFIGVPTGLSSGGKGIRAIAGNPSFTVVANNLSAVVNASTDVKSFTTSTFDKTVIITSGGVAYSILGTKY